MKSVALILARGGSKGIPNKNISMLGGQPLIAYTINAAKYSNVDEVWVSTDSSMITSVAKQYGAKVIHRPEEFARDDSPNEESLLHFSDVIGDFDVLVSIQPTSPLLSPEYINRGLDKIGEGYDSAFTAYREHWYPRWSLDVKPIDFKNGSRPRRQDRDEVYVENGAVYVTTKNALVTNKARVSGNIAVVEMPFGESLQIDTYDDMELLEKLV